MGGESGPRAIWHFPKGSDLFSPTCHYEGFSEETINIAQRIMSQPRGRRVTSGKVVLVGDVGVGKTSLVNRFSRNVFNNEYKSTIGVDFEIEAFDILGCPFHLQLWDTAGQERFRSLAAAYYRGADVLLVVFDMSERESVESVPEWVEQALSSHGSPHVPIFLVGTKKDMAKDYWCTALDEGLAMAEKIQAEFWATSALSALNLNDWNQFEIKKKPTCRCQ